MKELFSTLIENYPTQMLMTDRIVQMHLAHCQTDGTEGKFLQSYMQAPNPILALTKMVMPMFDNEALLSRAAVSLSLAIKGVVPNKDAADFMQDWLDIYPGRAAIALRETEDLNGLLNDILEQCKQMGMSINHVAEKAEIASSSIYSWKTGSRKLKNNSPILGIANFMSKRTKVK